MKHRLVLLAALGLALTGCSSDPAPVAAPTTTVVTTTTPPPTTTATTPAPVTTTPAAPVVETTPEVVEPAAVPVAITDAECDAFAAASSLPNAQLFPLMREMGCGARLDELEAAAEASIAAEAAAQPTTDYSDLMDCPAGQVFSGLGGGCMSPEQAAQISSTEALCGGGDGPVDICGPGRSGSGG